MSDLSDEEVVLRIKAGEIDFFAVIVKKYTPIVYNFVRSRLYQKEEVDDIIQNAFLSFYKAIDTFDEKRSVLPYLFEIVRNEIKMFLRSRKKTYALSESIASEERSQDDVVEEDIEHSLSLLPAREKQALIMVSRGYSYEEIAKKLEKPLNTVRTIIRRARLKVKKIYENA